MIANLNDGIHYNWAKTLSYAADVTMVIGAPNKGKTYGIRAYALDRYLRHGRRFVEVCRTNVERDDIKHGYFDKLALAPALAGYEFRCSRNVFEVRREGEPWRACGYIVSMTELQRAKRKTYIDVETIIMDEALIERIDRYHTYLRDEWSILSRVVDSCAREQLDGDIRPHVYLLGNAVDLINPYFQAFGIKGVPPYGYSWHNGKMCLLHYVEHDEADAARLTGTLAGRMGSVTGYSDASYGNRFREDMRFIGDKPPRAKYMMAVRYMGEIYAIWCDYTDGLYYVNGKVPKGAENVFALTRDDASVNALALRRTSKALASIVDMYYAGAVLYDSPRTREGFLSALSLLGVR